MSTISDEIRTLLTERYMRDRDNIIRQAINRAMDSCEWTLEEMKGRLHCVERGDKRSYYLDQGGETATHLVTFDPMQFDWCENSLKVSVKQTFAW